MKFVYGRDVMQLHRSSISQGRILQPGIPRHSGFTLIELLIALTIVGILAAIIVPSYNAQVQKTRRGDAKISLTKAAQELERCFSDVSAYNNAACRDFTGGVASDDGHYTITATTQTATAFTLEAKPVNGGLQAGDTNCAKYRINNLGLKTALDKDDALRNDCW